MLLQIKAYSQIRTKYYLSRDDLRTGIEYLGKVPPPGHYFRAFFNEKEQMFRLEEFEVDTSLYKIELFKYDENGNMTRREVYDKEGYLLERDSYEIDIRRSEILRKMYGSTFQLVEHHNYSIILFDKYNKPVKYIIKGVDGSIMAEVEYEYDSLGYKNAEIWYLGDKDKSEGLYFRKFEFIFDPDTEIETVIESDGKGQIISRVQLTPPIKQNYPN
jgi:hypothetical protein